MMCDCSLTPFWLESPLKHGPIGFGVTATSLDDAIRIIQVLGYQDYLPNRLEKFQIIHAVEVTDLMPHVVRTMGPINVRGMWYPFTTVGIPAWAMERLDRQR